MVCLSSRVTVPSFRNTRLLCFLWSEFSLDESGSHYSQSSKSLIAICDHKACSPPRYDLESHIKYQ